MRAALSGAHAEPAGASGRKHRSLTMHKVQGRRMKVMARAEEYSTPKVKVGLPAQAPKARARRLQKLSRGTREKAPQDEGR